MATELTAKQALRREKLLKAITGRIEPVRTPLQYRLILLLAAFIMVLLPLIYVGIACAFAYAVYYHMVHSVSIFNHVRGRGAIMAVIIYVGPLIAGVTAVFFMFKPLFSRAPERDKPTSLSRDDEPILFDFVDKLCDSVYAPRPRRIDVDCQVNASASFRRGWLSMLLGNDLVLTIGLPLVAGMSLRQFTGILAHEFGHFAQGGGMRLTYVIRTVSHWFTRVVYERDSWDESLERWSQEVDLRIGIIFYLARACVWLTRRILWVLMMIGHGVSGLLLRQMEFDADRHEVRFSGSDLIEPTTRRLHELMVAHSMAFNDLSLAYREGRLADDMIRLVSANADDLPDDVEEYIDRQVSEGQTGWLDTHPCDRERIESGQKENTPGVFRADGSAKTLFVNFQRVSHRATVNMYRISLGDEFNKDQLRSAEEIIESREAVKRSSEAMRSFGQDGWIPLQPFPVPDNVQPVAFDDSGKGKLIRLRKRMLNCLDTQKQAIKQIGEADDALNECSRALTLLRSGFTVKRDTFSCNLSSREHVGKVKDARRADLLNADNASQEYLKTWSERLFLSIGMLSDPNMNGTIENAEAWTHECDQFLLPALRALISHRSAVVDFRAESQRFFTCMAILNDGVESEKLFSTTRDTMRELAAQVGDLGKAFGNVAYPFEHSDAEMTLARFLVPNKPGRENPGEVYAAVETLLENYFSVYDRIISRLCEIALSVEESLGLERLPVPKDDDATSE